VVLQNDLGVFFTLFGPKTKLPILLRTLKQYHFEPQEENREKGIPWEQAAKADLEKYSKPGFVLKGARIKEGLTQTTLAKRLKIPQGNVSQMETGKRAIGKAMAHRLEKILKIDYRVFL
jgi:ribosome-binding protein aMBF1 (putative translation factor)